MRLTQLDGLRGIFSLMVVIYHFPQTFDISFNNIVLNHSYVFVDYFFCLSGFVISLIYSQKISDRHHLKEFLLKRVIRLYPLHLFVLILYLLGFYIIGYDKGSFLLKFLNSLFLTNSTPLISMMDGINTPSWSISSELISYSLIAIIFWIVRKKNQKVLSSIAIICLSIFVLIFYNIPFFSLSNFGFLRGLIGFNFGVLSFYIFNRYREKKIKHLELFFPLMLVILFSVISKTQETPNDTYSILINSLAIPLIMSSSILLILFSRKGIVSKFLNSKYIQELGLISYSIYLTHSFIFNVFEIPLINQFSSSKLFFVVIIAIVIMFSKVTYRLIEFRLSNFLKNKFLK